MASRFKSRGAASARGRYRQTRLTQKVEVVQILKVTSDGRQEILEKKNIKGAQCKNAVIIKNPITKEEVAFQYHRKFKCFQVRGVNYAGVCKQIDELLYPEGFRKSNLFKELTSRYEEMAAFLPKFTEENKSRGKKRKAISNPGAALARGRRVHDMVDKYVKGGQQKLPSSGYLHHIIKTLTHDPFYFEILKSEAPCWWDEARMATRADILCVDKEGRLVIIEVKTTGAPMSAVLMPQESLKQLNEPFHKLSTAIITGYHMQALATLVLYEKSGKKVEGGCGVLLAKPDQAILQMTPDNIMQLRPALEKALIELRTRW